MDLVVLSLAKKGAKAYTDQVIKGLGKGIVYKGAIDYYNNLPSNAELGNCYTVLYKGTTGTKASNAEYVWGTVSGNSNPEWIKLGDDSISEDLGDISTLNTTDKSSAVAAINELNTSIGDINSALEVI